MSSINDETGTSSGTSDPSDGDIGPSPDLAKPSGETAPVPTGGPKKKIGQLKMSGWIIYADSNNIYAKSPKGDKLKFVLVDPGGVVETAKPNKLSDNSDAKKSSSSSSSSTSSSSTSSSSSSSSSSSIQTSTNSTGSNNTSVAVASSPDNEIMSASITEEVTLAAADTTQASTTATDINDVVDSTPNGTRINAVLNSFFRGDLKETSYIAEVQNGKIFAEMFIERELEDEEWDNLLAVTYAESHSNDYEEQAWIMGTILNRSRQSGITVNEIISQPNQFESVMRQSVKFDEGPPMSIEIGLNLVASKFLTGVAKNNYYYTQAEVFGMVGIMKHGVPGTLIGSIFVYPGARWP